MAGKHRAKQTARRKAEAYSLVGTGAITLGLGIAFTAGSGVAQAEPTASGTTTTIRTTISAQSVNTSTYSSVPAVAKRAAAGEGPLTSVVISKDSVVRQQNPAVTGDDNPGPSPTLAENLIGLGQGDVGLTTGIPGLDAAPSIPFIELGGGGGGLLSKIAGALSGGLL
jgi:hypothetical protein